jgi:hypothetical protein
MGWIDPMALATAMPSGLSLGSVTALWLLLMGPLTVAGLGIVLGVGWRQQPRRANEPQRRAALVALTKGAVGRI